MQLLILAISIVPSLAGLAGGYYGGPTGVSYSAPAVSYGGHPGLGHGGPIPVAVGNGHDIDYYVRYFGNSM